MLYGSGPATWRRSTTSVLTACGRRQRRRNSLTYVLDLLAFAVETGRLTEACGEVVKSIALQTRNLETTAATDEIPAPPPSSPRRPSFAEQADVCSSSRPVTVIEEDKVVREVRYRKMYNQDGVDGVALGLTPFDVATHDLTTRRTFPTSRFHREFPPMFADASPPSEAAEVFSSAWCGCRDTLTLLLARLEQLKGTPNDEISSEISAKTKLVHRQLLEAGKGEVYKRLVRALDQRAPPDQRLLKNESRRSPHHVLKQGSKSTLPSCWAKRKTIGSQLFLQPSKLSDYVRTDD